MKGWLRARVVWAAVMAAGVVAGMVGASVAGPVSAAAGPARPAGPSLTGTLPLPTLAAGPAKDPWRSPSAGNTPSDVSLPRAQASGPDQQITTTPDPATTTPATSPTEIGTINTSGTWGNAIEVPGTAALNVDGHALVTSISCASAGNCAAGGLYRDSSVNQQAFVADEVNGIWGNAIEVPGTAALNTGGRAQGRAQVTSVSCGSAGNCAAGGYYTDSSLYHQAFVADEVNGTWGNAIEVPGTAALNTGGNAHVTSVSCTSSGNCTAGGNYSYSYGNQHVFVADEVNGTWGSAIEVPGTAALNTGWLAEVTSVSCASAGNCSAGGYYRDSSLNHQAFVADEVNGTWGNATEVPGTAALNTGGNAQITSISCASAGNCSAGGVYSNNIAAANVVHVPGARSGNQAFVVSEVNGTWGTAIEVPGTPALNLDGSAWVLSVSCASAGNCTAGGLYRDSSVNQQAFVADEVNGTWGTAIEVPGTAALNTGGNALVTSVSCTSAANCTVAGGYQDNSHHLQAFVDSEH